MTSMSKLFYEATKGTTCADFCHPNQSCIRHVLSLLYVLPKGCFKLYVPLLIIPPLLKGKQLKIDYLKRHVMEYVDLSLKTFFQAFIAVSSVCLLHALFGKVTFYGIMAVPGMMSAVFAPKMIYAHLRLQSLTFFNMMIEVLIKKSNIGLIRILRRSKLCGTVSFMAMSSVIMNVLEKDTTNQFWIAAPVKSESVADENENLGQIEKDKQNNCQHSSSCWKFLLKEIAKYGSVGLILELAHNSIRYFPLLMQKKTSLFISNVLKSLKLSLPLFLSSYVGLFQGLTCLMTRYRKSKDSNLCAKAGFISGIAYYLYPKFNIWTLALTKSIELFWNYRTRTVKEGSQLEKLKKVVDKVPVLVLMRIVALGVMYHTALFYPHLSPMFNHKAFNFCSDNAVQKMKSCVFGSMLGLAYSQTW